MNTPAAEDVSHSVATASLKPLFVTVVTAKLLVAALLIANLNLVPHAWVENSPQIASR